MVSLSESDLMWAAVTALAGAFFLACCVGICCWRDAQRRHRWDNEKDVDGGSELSAIEGGLPVSRLARAAAAKAAAAMNPKVAPLLAKGYVAPSKRIDAQIWRQHGNNVQSKFAKVTAVFEDFSVDDQLFRAYGALSIANEDDSEPRSARSARSTPSMDSGSSVPLNEKARSKSSKKDAGLGKKAPRRGEKSTSEKKTAAKSSQGGDAQRGRTLSAEAQAALEGRAPGKGASRAAAKGNSKPLTRVQPPPLLDVEALRPTMLGKNGEKWPVTDPPPPPLSPVPLQPPPLPPPLTPPSRPPSDDKPGTTKTFVERRVPPTPKEEVLPLRPPSSLPPAPLAHLLPNGGDLLSQIEFPAEPPRKKSPVAPHSPAPSRKMATPVHSEDEESASSGFEDAPRHRTPRLPQTPEAGRRDLKFAALDAELAEEVQAEVTRAVSLAFDPKALQRSSSGLPCPLGERDDTTKKAKKRPSSPKNKEKKQKRTRSVGANG